MQSADNIKKLIREFAVSDNERSFEAFFNHYYPRLFRFALFILNSELLAEEAVSDIFLKVWKSRSRLPDIDNIDYYLFTSVRNQSLSYLKQRNIEKLQVIEFDDFSLIHKIHPESELLDRELIEKVNAAVEKLPPKCQLIFRLSRDEGFKYEEIAEILELSKSTVKNQMTKALKKIKEELSSYFNDLDDKKYRFLMSILF
ncbi:MAG: RNA polymerase sigma-70 factor [Cytophagales bacterium]|nr:RNA polymerase sigma-70 factor [Cytophagales bacterium]